MPRTMLPRWVLGVLPAAALTGAVAAPAAGVPAGGAPVVAVHRFTSDDTGATYLLWRTIAGAGDTATMTVKLRAVAPGATALGPTRTVAVDPAVMPLGGRLNGNDFLRADAYPKLDVARLPDGQDRIFVAWDRCGARVGAVCEASRAVLTWSDTAGVRWTEPVVVTPDGPGNRYFPTLSVDASTHRLAIGYYSTELDPTYDSGQDVFTEIWDTVHPHRLARYRITPATGSPGADPTFPQTFIGSYFQVFAVDGRVYQHFTATYVRQRLAGRGLPVPQADNYLATLTYDRPVS